MSKIGSSNITITENQWRVLLFALSIGILLITVYCLSRGITVVFMHLYYIPIILLAYHYRKTGLYLSILLSFFYLALVVVFLPADMEAIVSAAVRVVIFIGIAALVAYLSEHLLKMQEDLWVREDMFRGVTERGSDLILLSDNTGRATYISPSVKRMLGYEPAELDGAHADEFFHPDDIESLHEIIRKNLAGTAIEHVEARLKKKDGDYLFVDFASSPIIKDGKISGIQVIGRDITESKRAEMALKSRDTFMKNIMDSMIAGVVIIDPETHTIVDMNAIAARMIGVEKEQIKGSVCHNYICPAQEGECPITDLFQVVDKSEKELIRADGTKIPILKSVVPVNLNNHTVLIESFIDISEIKAAESALKESEEKYRMLAELSSDMITIFDLDAVISYVSPAVERILGYRPEEIIGKNAFDFAAGVSQEEKLRIMGDLKTERHDIRKANVKLLRKDGTTVTVENIISPIYREGTFSGFLIVGRDITEQKQAEEALRQSEEKYRALFNNANDIITLHEFTGDGLPGRFIEVNDAACRLLGYTQEELLRMSPADLEDPQLWEQSSKNAAQLVTQGHITFDTVILTKERKKIPMEVSAHIFEFKERKMLISILRDITERKEADAKQAESEEKFRGVAERSSDLIVLTDPEGMVTYVAPSVRRILGYNPEEVYGKSPLDFIHPDDIDAVFEGARKNMAGSVTENLEVRIRKKDGDFAILDITGSPIMKYDRPIGVQIIGRDITERKLAENRLNYRLKLEKLISSISAEIINLKSEDLDIVIDRALKSIGALTSVDRSYIFLFDENGSTMHNAYEWCAEGITPQIENLQDLPLDMFPWWLERLRRYETIHVPKVADLPPDAENEKEILQSQEIQSIVVVPLAYEGRLIGFLGFDSVRQEKTWAIEDIGLLRTTGEIFSSAYEHRRAEKALAESEERFRGVSERSSDIIQLTDLEGQITYVSPSIKRILGFDPDEVIGSTPDYLVHPDDIGVIHEAIKKITEGLLYIDTLETRVRKKGGGYATLEVLVSPVIKDGAITGMQVMGRDITERKRAEIERDRLVSLIRHSSELVGLASPDRKIIFLNEAGAKMIGMDMEEALGSDFFDFVPDSQKEYVQDTVVSAIIKDGHWEGDLKYQNHKTGELIDVHAMTFLIIDPLTGAPQFLATVSLDITDRKRAEAALKEYSENLEDIVDERTKEIREMQEELVKKEKLAVLGKLAGGVGHELRNPLGAVKNAAYFLNMVLENPEPDVKESLEIMNTEITRSEDILSSLLDFARPTVLTLRKTRLNNVLSESVTRNPLPENIGLELELDENLPEVMADPDKLLQVFTNLITNAVQAMPDGGNLTVTSKIPEQGFVAVSVRDTGTGISDENMKKLFEPLFTTKVKGIGLGLVVTKSIVEAHQGKIEVRTEVGKGTTFTVTLPVGIEEAA